MLCCRGAIVMLFVFVYLNLVPGLATVSLVSVSSAMIFTALHRHVESFKNLDPLKMVLLALNWPSQRRDQSIKMSDWRCSF